MSGSPFSLCFHLTELFAVAPSLNWFSTSQQKVSTVHTTPPFAFFLASDPSIRLATPPSAPLDHYLKFSTRSLPAQFSGTLKPGGGGGTFFRCPATQTFAKLVLPHATLLPAYPDGVVFAKQSPRCSRSRLPVSICVTACVTRFHWGFGDGRKLQPLGVRQSRMLLIIPHNPGM